MPCAIPLKNAKQLQCMCADAGFRPQVVQEAARAQAVAVMVAAGVGISILPASIARNTDDSLVAVPLADKSAYVTYVFAHRPGQIELSLADFVSELTAEINGDFNRSTQESRSPAEY